MDPTKQLSHGCHMRTHLVSSWSVSDSCIFSINVSRSASASSAPDANSWCPVPGGGADALLFAALAVFMGCLLYSRLSSVWTLLAGQHPHGLEARFRGRKCHHQSPVCRESQGLRTLLKSLYESIEQ